ncbi:hypothetical protein [Celeribacter sp.]|uniref:hypothetical protein n=1 Tax=Celeribacter sp. TaxID=1890673 RepID=UPI003A8D695F
MMFPRLIIAAALSVSATCAFAQEEIVGLWSLNELGCQEPESLIYQGYSITAHIYDDQIEIHPNEFLQARGSSWFLSRSDTSDAFPTLMRAQDGQLEFAWLDSTPSADEVPGVHEGMLAGELIPERKPEQFDTSTGESCSGYPLEISLVFGEALAFLQDLDEAVWTCQGDVRTCPAKIFAVADVSGDSELSVAEMARVFRASLTLGSASSSGSASDEFVAAVTAGFTIAPLASSAVLHSFDYDRSGGVDLGELLTERLPADWDIGSAPGSMIKSMLDDLGDVARLATGAASMMMP